MQRLHRWRVVALVVVVVSGLVAGPAEAQRGRNPVPHRLTTETFEVWFAPGDSLRAVAVADALVSQPPLPALPPEMPRGVTVVLAPDETAFRWAAGGVPPAWSAAVAIPAWNRIVLPPFGSDRAAGTDPYRTLRHEWAHIALRQALAGRRVPRWFDEGYAQWAAGWDRLELWRLRLQVALGRTPPLDSLNFGFPRDRGAARDAYLLSATTVEYLVQASGEEALGIFVGRWREEGDFEAALREVYGVGTPQLEEDWREWLSQRYGLLSVITGSSIGWALLALLVVVLFQIRRTRDRERLARLRATELPPTPVWWDEPPPGPPPPDEPEVGSGG